MAVVLFLLSLSPIFIILYTYYLHYNTCPRCSSRQTSSPLFIFLCSISSIISPCLSFIIFLTMKYLVLLLWVYIIFQFLSLLCVLFVFYTTASTSFFINYFQYIYYKLPVLAAAPDKFPISYYTV